MEIILQGNFGQGWEEVCRYDADEEIQARCDLIEYEKSRTGHYRLQISDPENSIYPGSN